MSLFNRKNPNEKGNGQAALAELALNAINNGVIMTDKAGVIKYINPAAISITDCGSVDHAIGLDYGLIIKLESKEGRELSEKENPLTQSMKTGEPLDSFHGSLIVGKSEKRVPIAVSAFSVEGVQQDRIITFRDITKELEEEGEQTEFISTASHEMRTPVASIEGYLSLALNPQTATIDERAKGYLTAAHAASKHLGKLFRDLLDITKLDDGHIKPHFEPAEMVGLVKTISDDYLPRARDLKINLKFGSDPKVSLGDTRRMEQVVYGYIDMNFMREILDNLIDNALKYTPEGGSIYVNVRGDGDRVLINVTDTGIGISADDLSHIFQKFYRADNSDTRVIGGTGLGLYLVKQRVEAMGGRVWAESAFGEGSTFYVSLPRLTGDEYEKRMIAVRNRQMQEELQKSSPTAPTQSPQLTAFQVAASPTPISIPTPTPAHAIPQNPSIPTPTTPPTPTPQPPAPNVTNPIPPGQNPAPPTNQPVQNQINNNINGEVK